MPYKSVHHVQTVSRRPEKDTGSHGTGITDGCKLTCGCWELNLGHLQEQPVLLSAEPSLHS